MIMSYRASERSPIVPRMRPWNFPQELSLALVFFLGFLSYTTNDDKTVIYIATLLLFLVAVASQGFRIALSSQARFFSILYFLIVFLSILVNFYQVGLPIQVMAYPCIFFIGIGMLWRIYLISSSVKFFIVGIFLLNAVVALLSIGLNVSSIPVFGDITRGRYIFFTNFRSSAGMLWNVNYFALCQAVGFWVSYSLLMSSVGVNKSKLLSISVLIFLAVSVFFGSSRSISVLFLSTIFFGFFKRSKLFFLFLIIIALIIGVNIYEFYLQNSDFIHEALRLNRGLNSRDEIWLSGLIVHEGSPFFGYGSTNEVGRLLLVNGSPTTSVQSSFFAYLLLFGWLGLVFFLAVVLRTFVLAFYRMDSEPAALGALCNILLLVGDSFSRTFILGGVGLLPLVFLASIGFFLRSPYRKV